MSLHRKNPRRDSNEKDIVQALTAQGFHVTRISGTGVPDLLVSKRRHYPWQPQTDGMCWLVEVKMPKGTYTAEQISFRESWQGPPIITLRTIDDALHFPLLACETK